MKNDEKILEFFRAIFNDVIDIDGFLYAGQYIRLWSPLHYAQFFSSLGDAVKYTQKHTSETFFQLSTTNDSSGKTESLVSRTVLGFDFDKKTNQSDMIIGMF